MDALKIFMNRNRIIENAISVIAVAPKINYLNTQSYQSNGKKAGQNILDNFLNGLNIILNCCVLYYLSLEIF